MKTDEETKRVENGKAYRGRTISTREREVGRGDGTVGTL